VCPSIFSMSGCHPSFSPTFFSCFISLFFFIPLFYSLCFILLSAHYTPGCASTVHSRVFLLLLRTSSILSIFMYIISKIPVQQAPNTHLWLVPSHLGLLCAPPSLDEFLGGFLNFHNFLYYFFLCFHNLFDPLQSRL
jgi:hypothetical protein